MTVSRFPAASRVTAVGLVVAAGLLAVQDRLSDVGAGAAASVAAPPAAAGLVPAAIQGAAYLPLCAKRQDVLDRPSPPTATPVPATATAEPTVAPTPFRCPPLAERVRVTDVDVHPHAVNLGSGRVPAPRFAAPLPDGASAVVAWSDTAGGVHITHLDEWDLPTGPAWDLTGDEVRGLVVHPGDGVAVLVVRGESLFLVRLDASGRTVYERHLIGGGSHEVAGNKWVDNWGHEARLVWADERYGVYSGHTQQFGAQGKHQGDLLWYMDADGERLPGREGWDWGCSHSLDLRLAHNGTRFGPVCLSDAYPTTGFHFNHRTAEIRKEPSGDGRGFSAANLGGWVSMPDGFLMSFSSPEGRASSDVGLIHVANDGRAGSPLWLTDTPGVQERAPHLARYGDAFLAGWTADNQHLVAVVDATGTMLEGPQAIEATIAAKDDMVGLPNGDVLWAHSWRDTSLLRVVRVAWCDDTPSPATPVPSVEPATATLEGPAEPATPRPTRTPRDVTPGTPEPTPTNGPPAPTAAGPATCRDVLANGTFEDGLTDWRFEGEVALRDGGRPPGRRAAMLLGRNAVTGRLAQTARVPAETTALYLTYWWRLTSDEPLQLTRAYDTVQSRVTAGGAEPLPLEVLSNLAARDVWLPSAYGVPATGGTVEVSFHADSNGRDPSRLYLDDVALIACTGTPPAWPALSVEPPGGTVQTRFSGRAAGLRPGERASHWLLEPASLVRFDLPLTAALPDGVLEATFTVHDTAGRWTWAVAGHEEPLPGRVSFVVEGAP